jgi:threonine synthase
MLREQGRIDADAQVVCILTGHLLKDMEATANFSRDHPNAAPANQPRRIAADLGALERVLREPRPAFGS